MGFYLNKIRKFKMNNFDPKQFFAGMAGGAASNFILHPIDLARIRFSVGDGHVVRPKYTSIVDLCQSVYKKQGVRGLYTGVSPSVIGAGLSWGLYFLFYDAMKNYFKGGDQDRECSTIELLTAGCVSGAGVLTVTNPIWVAKTRMCLQYENTEKTYRGLTHTIKDLFAKDGFRGFYRGYVPGLFGTSHGAIHFLVYERLRSRLLRFRNKKDMDNLDTILCSTSSKFVAASATFPLLVLKSRLQDQHRGYNGVIDVLQTTVRNETWKGLYKGLTANLVRVMPAVCITFCIKENLMRVFGDHRGVVRATI